MTTSRTMHIPTDHPACWTDQQPAPWKCMAFDSADQRRELQGDSCDGCSKAKERTGVRV